MCWVGLHHWKYFTHIHQIRNKRAYLNLWEEERRHCLDCKKEQWHEWFDIDPGWRTTNDPKYKPTETDKIRETLDKYGEA